jgi:hypothetical protein
LLVDDSLEFQDDLVDRHTSRPMIEATLSLTHTHLEPCVRTAIKSDDRSGETYLIAADVHAHVTADSLVQSVFLTT